MGSTYRTITYERSGTVVTYDCAPVHDYAKVAAKPACSTGGSQACSPACSCRGHSSGPCGTCSALQSQILPPEKVAQSACFSVERNIDHNRHFPARVVVHTPLCLHVLFRVARPLHSNWGCKGTVTWGILGYVPSGVRPLTMQGGGGG